MACFLIFKVKNKGSKNIFYVLHRSYKTHRKTAKIMISIKTTYKRILYDKKKQSYDCLNYCSTLRIRVFS